ncbi:hypothetical protein TEPIDINF_000969 [Tepidibacillus infernus]|uniref:hypothetical protein n=1 Tax=Tepidibacillus infernus TaxID=1806172 RepID=UPI003A1847BF
MPETNQPLGKIKIKINEKGIVEELLLIQNKTRILFIEQEGKKIKTTCHSISGKYNFSKKDLEYINQSILKELTNSKWETKNDCYCIV